MSLAPVHIQNSTDYPCTGTVTYKTDNVCSPDDYSLDPLGSWTASSRGLCRISVITAQLTINGELFDAIPCKNGDGHSQFLVTLSGNNQYAVVRKE